MKKLRMPIALVVLALIVFFGWMLFGGAILDAYYQSAAENAISAGEPLKAADLLAKRLESAPRNLDLRMKVCNLYIDGDNLSRAEYILYKGLTDMGPDAAVYTKLSYVYSLQDKLYDAVTLLDNINSPGVSSEIQAARPTLPAVSPAPGGYTELQTLTIQPAPGTTVYYSLQGDVPSMKTGQYTEPVELPPGSTTVRLAAVDENGLVSRWMTVEYSLENIVMPVRFADPAAEAVLRALLDKPDGYLYTDDFWDVEEITVPEPADYTTLADFALCTGLKSLSLVGTHSGCDLTGLSSLTTLESLSLREMGITTLDLPALSPLTGLTTLDLSKNSIGDISALSALENLRKLDLSFNSLLDVSPLSALTALTRLDLSQNAVSDLTPLGTLTALETLALDENRIQMLTGLSSLRNLIELSVSNNKALLSVADAFALPALQKFTAAGCGLEELPPPEDVSLPSLTFLDLSDNLLTSLEALRGFPGLETLHIENNAVVSLSPLTESLMLQDIYAAGNGITGTGNLFDGTGIKVHL